MSEHCIGRSMHDERAIKLLGGLYNMTELLITVITSNALLIGVLGYLSKSLITQWLNKDIEIFKSDINAKLTHELETYKSKLEKERITLQVAYSGIFSKQAESILDLYKKLVKLDDELRLAIHMMETEFSDKYILNAIKSWLEFDSFFNEHKILLPEDVASVVSQIQKVFNSTLKYRELSLKSSMIEDSEQLRSLLSDRDKSAIVANEFPRLKASLEVRFRDLIGSVIMPSKAN